MNGDDMWFCRDRRNPIILDRRLQFVYFPNNKVCQTSIARNVLAHRAVVRKDSARRWDRWFDKSLAAASENTFCFTVVRNPFDLVVSAYFYLQKRNHVVSRYGTFEEFVLHCLHVQGATVDPHFLPQSEKLFREGEAFPDMIAHFETIGEDWPQIATAIGESNTSLPHANASSRQSWQSYYDNATLDVVRALYEADFRYLGYERFLSIP